MIFRIKLDSVFLTSFAAKTYAAIAMVKIVDKILFMDANQLLEQLDLAMKQLASLRDLIVIQQPLLPPSIADESAKGICHKCKLPLGDKKPIRGCHSACNQEMNRMKARNEITDDQLMVMGWIGPPARSGRKRKTSVQDLRDAQERAISKADQASPLAQKKQKKSGDSTS